MNNPTKKTEWRYVTIVKAPDFPAPHLVKEALVGLHVRLYAICITEPYPGEITQLITGKPVGGYIGGYAVEQDQFLAELQKKNLKAWIWFNDQKFPQQKFFAFKRDEVVEDPIPASAPQLKLTE